MPQLDMMDITGSSVGQIELNPEIFEVPVFETHLHMAVVRQLANMRTGTSSTKTRGEVSGGGKKPWKQKGTGRARHGSSRSPIWKGGGVVFGPKPRSYKTDMNKKMRRLALKEAFSAKFMDGTFIVLDQFSMEKISTKAFADVMEGIKTSGKTLFVLKDFDENVTKSGRNIKNVKIVKPEGVSVYDLLYHETLVMDKAAVDYIEEVLS